MKSHYHGATWILLREHGTHFWCLIYFPTYCHLKISTVKWLCLSGTTPVSYMVCTAAVSQQPHVMSLLSEDWTWVLWGVSSSLHAPALLHTKAEICTREALQQDRNFGKCSVRRGERHVSVWCLSSFLATTLVFWSLRKVVSPPPVCVCFGGC